MAGCMSYDGAKKVFIFLNLVMLGGAVASIIFGTLALREALDFVSRAKDYCKEQCLLTQAAYEVGCNCRSENGKSLITPSILQAPGGGGIFLGASLIILTCYGLWVSLKDRHRAMGFWIILMTIHLIIGLGIGAASLGVALGSTNELTGPIYNMMRVGNPPNYKRFNWKFFEDLMDQDCFRGVYIEYDTDWVRERNVQFFHPLCGFDGECVSAVSTPAENSCCYREANKCAEDHSGCTYGRKCLESIFKRIGLIVGIVLIVLFFLQLVAILLACTVKRDIEDHKEASFSNAKRYDVNQISTTLQSSVQNTENTADSSPGDEESGTPKDEKGANGPRPDTDPAAV
mmetsp:Transcript_4402/g.7075  ORF Transcript_4402/g.7075 Transcript_4402/m.7075 type:complete len:344 (+) Transcript_4402:103-1134(+)